MVLLALSHHESTSRGRQQHERIGVRVAELAPERAGGPVDRGDVAGEKGLPVGQVAVDRAVPDRNVIRSPEHLDHVVTGPAQELFERELLGVRTGPSETRPDDAQRHEFLLS